MPHQDAELETTADKLSELQGAQQSHRCRPRSLLLAVVLTVGQPPLGALLNCTA